MRVWHTRNSQRGGLGRWLQAPGSLSARLAATGRVFDVQVLDQGRRALTRDEAAAIGACGRVGYVREVILRVDGLPKVFARSVTSHADSLGVWRSVRGLGARPLADVLFKRLGILRQPLHYNRIKPGSPLHRHLSQTWRSATQELLAHRGLSARRSVFLCRGAPLLVMEVFAAPASDWRWPGIVLV